MVYCLPRMGIFTVTKIGFVRSSDWLDGRIRLGISFSLLCQGQFCLILDIAFRRIFICYIFSRRLSCINRFQGTSLSGRDIRFCCVRILALLAFHLFLFSYRTVNLRFLGRRYLLDEFIIRNVVLINFVPQKLHFASSGIILSFSLWIFGYLFRLSIYHRS